MQKQQNLIPEPQPRTGSDLFIVDNTDEEWKVLRYLKEWCPLAKSIDIATGYFEIGSLLALDGEWQKVDSFRLLMGDEVTGRTRKTLLEGTERIKRILDSSIEKEKEKNDFLKGTPAIVDAMRSGKIRCRVYSKKKFHAKTYITHARQEVIGSFALVGSSNSPTLQPSNFLPSNPPTLQLSNSPTFCRLAAYRGGRKALYSY